MSFVQAFLESGRNRGERLVQLEGLQSIALESFALDAEQIVDIFNAVLSEDAGYKLEVQPVLNSNTGLLMNVPFDGAVTRSVYIDIGYVPDTQEYTVSERDSGVSGKHNEFDMRLAVAEIVLKNLQDEQYLKFYRALLNDGQSETETTDSVIPFAAASANYVHHEVVFEEAPVTQEAVITPFPSNFVPADEIFTEIKTSEEDDEDDIWGDDDSEAPVDKHLSTDVVMR